VNKRELVTLVDILTEGAAFVSPDGMVAAANRAFAVALGTGLEDIVGKSLGGFAPEATDLCKVIAETIERRPKLLRLSLKPKGRNEVGCSGALFAPESGEPLLFLRITESTAGDHSSHKTIDDFLTAVSHELRSPLNAIVTWAHVLRQGGLEPEIVSRALESIERNANLQSKLLDDLMAFARLGIEPVPDKGRAIDTPQPPPVEKDKPLGISAAAAEGRLADLKGVRVLVVDDDRDTRDSITALLVENRAEASNAGSVREALRSLAEQPPHVVVTDLLMPDLDGFSLLRMIRTIESLNAIRIPTIALTALSSEESQRRGLESGFDVYLMKPINPEELLSIVAAAAQNRPA
jgi:CheY-like chemotaxis protein